MQLVHHTTTDAAELVELDRPEKRNALDADLSNALLEAVLACRDRPRSLVVRSRMPGMFVAGADVDQLRRRTVEESLGRRNARLFQAIAEHPYPTVAVVAGAALGGGCELAMACDLRISTARAWWGLPEVRLGIVPSAGGLTRLTDLVGVGRARDLAFSGRRVRGTEAARLGLVEWVTDEVQDPDEAQAALDALLGRVLDELRPASMFAVRLAKEAMSVDGDRHRLVDAAAQALCIAQPDTQERLAAMLTRRSEG
ncbi:MAG: enoyl-CoA hydratase/isomerase family protein [Propionibacteriales bacterium]|nr:enoyl-CoA hydratase/isomerase family protein [Propionibacteriales bacterium]